MKSLFRIAPLAVVSFACVAVAWLFFGVFVVSGVNHRLGNSMDHVAQFAVLSPGLIAIVLGLASLIWNAKKVPGLIALMVAIAATLGLYAAGG